MAQLLAAARAAMIYRQGCKAERHANTRHCCLDSLLWGNGVSCFKRRAKTRGRHCPFERFI